MPLSLCRPATRPALRGLSWLLLASALVAPASAVEVTLANDSTVAGVPSSPGNFFIPGEEAAAWLTPGCSGDVVAVQVYWTSAFGGNPASLEAAIRVYAGGSHPSPGPVLPNQGGGNAVVVGPLLADTSLNEFRFLDPPADTKALRAPVTAGQPFAVSLEFLNQSSGNPFASGPGYDQDGCQPGRNGALAQPGGWADACAAGVPGDWVIRAVVDCAPVAPATPFPYLAAAAALLVLSGVLWLRRATTR